MTFAVQLVKKTERTPSLTLHSFTLSASGASTERWWCVLSFTRAFDTGGVPDARSRSLPCGTTRRPRL